MLSFIELYLLLKYLKISNINISLIIKEIGKDCISLEDVKSVLDNYDIFSNQYPVEIIVDVHMYLLKYLEKVKELNINIIDIYDVKYPKRLKNNFKNEYILYYMGDITLLNSSKIALVIGSRDSTGIDNNKVKDGIKKLVGNDYVIMSGLALGSDTLAHRLCLEHGGKTIAVLPSSIDNICPKQNVSLIKEIIKNNGLVISTFEIGNSIQKYNYILRDELMVKLCDKVLVIHDIGSRGVKHTIDFAKKIGKNVEYLN